MCLELAKFCVSSCLSQMAKIEVWVRKVQDKMEGVVLEVIDLTSEDGEGKEASGDVLGSPFLHPVMWNESEVTLGCMSWV